MAKTFYRYEQENGYYGMRIKLLKFNSVKETPCGFWIIDVSKYSYKPKKRWVSKKSRKRFAYPTQKEAMFAFKKRKERHIEILEVFLNGAKTALSRAEEALNDPMYFSENF